MRSEGRRGDIHALIAQRRAALDREEKSRRRRLWLLAVGGPAVFVALVSLVAYLCL